MLRVSQEKVLIKSSEKPSFFLRIIGSENNRSACEKIATLLKEKMRELRALEVETTDVSDKQISLTDPDARAIATNARSQR